MIEKSKTDSGAALAAAGILAYVTETVGHELVGHGGACLATGGKITALAPLWMRCSVETREMVLAGPLFNFAAAAILMVILLLRRRPGPFAYLLWLGFAFNLLVACGYVVVGGAIGFGDWNVLFAEVQPAWLWRVGAIGLGMAGYMLALRATAFLYARIAGPAKDDRPLFRGRALLPAAAAAVVAVAAEVVGGRTEPLALALPLACTLIVGWTVAMTDPGEFRATQTDGFRVHANRYWLVAAVALAGVFVAVIGPAPGSG